MAIAQQYHQNLVHYLRKEVNYNDPGIASGVVIGRLPANAQITQALARVRTTFNAGTTNVLTVGTNATNYDNIFGTADIAEGSAGNNAAPLANLQDVQTEADVFVKYTQTGTAASQGKAVIHIAYTVSNG
jgi:hypothetical protein